MSEAGAGITDGRIGADPRRDDACADPPALLWQAQLNLVFMWWGNLFVALISVPMAWAMAYVVFRALNAAYGPTIILPAVFLITSIAISAFSLFMLVAIPAGGVRAEYRLTGRELIIDRWFLGRLRRGVFVLPDIRIRRFYWPNFLVTSTAPATAGKRPPSVVMTLFSRGDRKRLQALFPQGLFP